MTDDGKLIPAAAFLKAHKALPQVVFFPEESDFQYRSGTAPLQDDWGGAALGTPLGAHLLYGRDAFVFELMQFTPGGGSPGPEPIFNNHSLLLEFAKIVQRGDVLRYQGWYNDSVNVFVKKVYEMAAAMPNLKSDDADVLTGDAGSAANSSVVFECRGKEGRDVHPNGYDDMRIPALLRLSNGDLLLFVEARIFSSDDNSPIDIAYKRSEDNGSSWSKLTVLHSETNATHNTTINNPNPVEDRRHPGTVHVVFSRAYRDMLVMSSTNYGRSFSAPIDISRDVLPVGTANWSKLVAGPVGAVQIEPSGRIAICARFSTIPRGAISTQGLVVYSDDGSSWHGIAQPTGWSECAFAQAPNSSVVAVLRQGLWRGFAWSEDNAKTFSDCGHTCSALPLVSSSNDCQAGLTTLSDGVMVLTQPHGDPIDAKTPESVCGSMNGQPVVWPDGHTGKGGNGRCNVSLHVSRDSARTWVAERVIAPPPVESGYSSVAALSPTAVGVAFEASCSISFVVEAGLSNPHRLLGKSDDDELAWVEEPQGWHQQAVRIVDHPFSTLKELRAFGLAAKKAGVSVVELVGPQKTKRCVGYWCGGLGLCDHINGSMPADDPEATLADWQQMLKDIRPVRLMWWANFAYWSTQGEVAMQAMADPTSDVGRFFSYGPNASSFPVCPGKWLGNSSDPAYHSYGYTNPCFKTKTGQHLCAQGSWGSVAGDCNRSGTSNTSACFDDLLDGCSKAVMEASDGGRCIPSLNANPAHKEYVDYLADSLANSWSRNLGIDGWIVDTSMQIPCAPGINPNYAEPGGSEFIFYNDVIGQVRKTQPQVVLSGEDCASWDDAIMHNFQLPGTKASGPYQAAVQTALDAKDLDTIEGVVASSGADAATYVCYLHPGLDGKNSGACPTLYYRDTQSAYAAENVSAYRLWVALEAASGILSEHQHSPTAVYGHQCKIAILSRFVALDVSLILKSITIADGSWNVSGKIVILSRFACCPPR